MEFTRGGNFISEVKTKIATQPISATVRAETQTWDYYKKGIITCSDSGCGTINHVVLVVGYVGTSYWIIRNSWSKDWGMNGDAYISMDTTDEKDCSILSNFYTVELF